jgi:hypothetical protein
VPLHHQLVIPEMWMMVRFDWGLVNDRSSLRVTGQIAAQSIKMMVSTCGSKLKNVIGLATLGGQD